MRAVVYETFGESEVLVSTEIEPPVLGRDCVRVRVVASSVNPVDWKIRQGRLTSVLDHWFPIVPGWDLAGEVIEVGPAVTEFVPGDRVFGYGRMDVVRHGTSAEEVCVPVHALAPAPKGIPLSDAAALPLAGLTAWQGLGAAGVAAGDVVLVNAAAGGVGHYVVQLAVARGAQVLAACSPRNHDFVADLGAVPVDRTAPLADGIARVGVRPTSGFDAVGGDALAEISHLVPAQRIASIADAGVNGLGGQYVFARPSPGDLGALAALVDAGELAPSIHERFELEHLAAAHTLSETGSVTGKLVVDIA